MGRKLVWPFSILKVTLLQNSWFWIILQLLDECIRPLTCCYLRRPVPVEDFWSIGISLHNLYTSLIIGLALYSARPVQVSQYKDFLILAIMDLLFLALVWLWTCIVGTRIWEIPCQCKRLSCLRIRLIGCILWCIRYILRERSIVIIILPWCSWWRHPMLYIRWLEDLMKSLLPMISFGMLRIWISSLRKLGSILSRWSLRAMRKRLLWCTPWCICIRRMLSEFI